MIILGIDPGIAIVGYGVIEYEKNVFRVLEYGSIETEANTDTDKRLEIIFNDLNTVIDRFKPTDMAVEELFFTNNQKTAIAVAEARGVILLAARMKALDIYEYTPLQVKQSVVGYGKAEKKQVIAMVNTILKLKEGVKLDDTADALAIAICHAHCAGSSISGFYNRRSYHE